jgi:polyisoprenoid-binding protein YceI
MTRSLLLAAAMLLFAAGAHAQPTPWTLDPVHSRIGFTARHLGFAKVKGEFKKFSAPVLEADAKTGKITKLEAEVDTTSITTGVEKRDAHLRADDFFAADKFPKAKLVLKSVKWAGKKLNAVVSLTVRDVTKDVKLTGELLGMTTVNFGQGPQLRAGYEATGKINRKEFGLKFGGLAEGVSVVGDDVELNLELEMSAPQPATPTAKAATGAGPGSATATAAGKRTSGAPAAAPAAAKSATPAAAKPAAAKQAAAQPGTAKP